MSEIRKNDHAGHRARLREQFIKHGINSFQQHQVLELLLFYAVPRRDTNELAHKLLNRFGKLSGVLTADIDELMSVSGVGEHTAIFLKAVFDIYAFYGNNDSNGKITVGNVFCADLYYHAAFDSTDGEQFGVTVTDTDHTVLFTESLPMPSERFDSEFLGKKIIETVLGAGGSRCMIVHFSPDKGVISDEERGFAGQIFSILAASGIEAEGYCAIYDNEITAIFQKTD